MKRTPLQRKTPPKAGRNGIRPSACWLDEIGTTPRRNQLRPTRSTGKPTTAEAARLVAVKQLGCIACVANRNLGMPTAGFGPCEAHHLLSGGRRRGHLFTIGLCPWHHRGVRPFENMTTQQTIDHFGPSVATGSKRFREVYGSDDELLSFQAALLTAERGGR